MYLNLNLVLPVLVACSREAGGLSVNVLSVTIGNKRLPIDFTPLQLAIVGIESATKGCLSTL